MPAEPAPPRTRRTRLILTLAVFALAAVAVAAARLPGGGDVDTGTALERGVGIEAPQPSLEAVVPTTLRPASLPIPDALPAEPYAPTTEITVGTIEIPKLGIDEPLHAGMTLTAIDRGPSWWPNTARPGEWGNVVVAGHRTTHSKPFARLHELEQGDHVIFTTDDGRFVYEVRGVIVVPGEWIDIAAQDWARTATLFACHPPGSDRERIVAKLRLLDEDGLPADDDADLPPLDAEARRTEHTLIVRTPSGDQPAGADPFAGTGG